MESFVIEIKDNPWRVTRLQPEGPFKVEIRDEEDWLVLFEEVAPDSELHKPLADLEEIHKELRRREFDNHWLGKLLNFLFKPMQIAHFGGVKTIMHKSAFWMFVILAVLSLKAFAAIFLIFTFVYLHEWGHIVVMRRFGVECNEIRIMPIGMAAVISDENEFPTPRASVYTALAGPAVNVAIGLPCVLLAADPAYHSYSLYFIAKVNFVLAAFNMLPVFPLDGGQFLRGICWRLTDSKERSLIYAARIAMFGSILLCSAFAASSHVVGTIISILIFVYASSTVKMTKEKLEAGEPVEEIVA